MAANPKTHHCDKCGCVVDLKTCTTLNLQEHSIKERRHWRTGKPETYRKTTSIIPQMKFCDGCATKAKDMLEDWINE